MAFLNLTLRFLLELGALGALCWSGFHLPLPWPARLLVAIGGPLAAAVIWGSYVAPRAPWRVQGWSRLVPEFAVFGGAAGALLWAGYPRTAAVFAAIALINTLAVHATGEER